MKKWVRTVICSRSGKHQQ